MRVRSILAVLLLASLSPLTTAFSTVSPFSRSHGSRTRTCARATRLDFEHELDQAWEAGHPTLDQSVSPAGDSDLPALPECPLAVTLSAPEFAPLTIASVRIFAEGPSPLHSGRAPPSFPTL